MMSYCRHCGRRATDDELSAEAIGVPICAVCTAKIAVTGHHQKAWDPKVHRLPAKEGAS